MPEPYYPFGRETSGTGYQPILEALQCREEPPGHRKSADQTRDSKQGRGHILKETRGWYVNLLLSTSRFKTMTYRCGLIFFNPTGFSACTTKSKKNFDRCI